MDRKANKKLQKNCLNFGDHFSHKIVFIAHSFEYGGAQKCLYQFVSYCCALGIRILIIGPKYGPQVADFEKLGVDVAPISLTSIMTGQVRSSRIKQSLKIILDTINIAGILLKFRPELVYTNTSVVISGAIASKLLRVRHFWHIHENYDTMQINSVIPPKVLGWIIEKFSEKVIFVSTLAMKSLLLEGSTKTVVVHNGIDLSNFTYFKPERLGKKAVIGFVGTIAYRKGLDILFKSIALLINAYQIDVILEIWGEGDSQYLAFLKAMAKELNIDDNIRFAGYSSNLSNILPKFNVLVVPSRGESFSLVVIEGMAAGVPVVATKCGGPEEIIDNGVDGLLVPSEDYESLAKAIKQVIENPDKAKSMAIKAREKVSKQFDINTTFETLIDLMFRKAPSL